MKKLFVLLLAASLGFPYKGGAQKSTAPRPNIVLIIGDDIGVDDIGCYGNKEVKTPNIDRLAKEGLRFTNAFVTTSSCSPSRASIITGRYPHNTGAAELHTPVPGEMVLFPELLQGAGYYTAQAGKWHLGPAPEKAFDKIHVKQKENGDGGEEMWIQTLQERPRNKPFFLWLAADDAHRQWGPNEFRGTHKPDSIVPPVYAANREATRGDIAHFYDEVHRFDYYIGRVEEELKKQGVLENTIIIIMGDNGRPFPRAKTHIYDSGVNTPFVVKWNKGILKKGAVSSSLLSTIDIAPTLLELAGVQGGPTFQGRSFTRLLKNPATPFRTYVFTEHNWHDYEAFERGVRTRNFLYIVNRRPNLTAADYGIKPEPSMDDLKALRDSGLLTAAQANIFMVPRPVEELYDVNNDPQQLLNLASVPRYAKELAHLRGVLQLWQQQTADSDPGGLTPDWNDRETLKFLDTRGKRGNMPGGEPARKATGGGPF